MDFAGLFRDGSKGCRGKKALTDGAAEIDMVVNITDIKNGDYDKVKRNCRPEGSGGDKILKVIIETCYLTRMRRSPCVKP